MQFMIHFAMMALMGLLGACSGLPRPASPPSTQGSVHTHAPSLTGRMTIVQAADASLSESRPRSVSAHFEFRGHARAGELDLATPLGTIMARAHWGSDGIWLQRPKQTQQFYASLSDLSLDALGQPLPMEAFFDWMQARPWAEGPPPSAVWASGFSQMGWDIDTSSQGEGRLVFTRALPPPSLTVRLVKDPPAEAAPTAMP
jgi:outer membrane lipoprotein LolB